MTIISESGLYSLILTSRRPEAKAFKKWITSVVLPSIRKTGGYGTNPAMIDTVKMAISLNTGQNSKLCYYKVAWNPIIFTAG